MNIPDLVQIIGNLSQSLNPIQHFITGFAYLLGILFIITAIDKFRKIADRTTQRASNEKMYSPLMFLFMGAALLYLPTAMKIAANTAFGAGNVLAYAPIDRGSIYSTISLLVRTAGVLWFVRGCVLIAHSSEPGTKLGPKGLGFLIAGVLAMNFHDVAFILNSILSSLVQMSIFVKKKTGF